jgi:hypothetical protein
LIEKVVHTARKEIRIRRALILGNFYNRAVEIVQVGELEGESCVDTIIGITSDSLLTKKGRLIKLSTIQTIYQL